MIFSAPLTLYHSRTSKDSTWGHHRNWVASRQHETPNSWQVFVPFLGWLSDPFKGLSDLQLGDEKGTLNHLAHI